MLDWTLKQTAEMGKKGLPKSKAEAESLIVEHQDWKVKAPNLIYTLNNEEYILFIGIHGEK